MKSKSFYFFAMSMALCLVLLSLTGCPKKPPKIPDVPLGLTETTTPEEAKPMLDFQSVPEISVINFDYDKSDLTNEARKILQDNAIYLKAHTELDVSVEGHCCECGTNEYNLALVVQEKFTSLPQYGQNFGPNLMAFPQYGQ